MASTDLATRPVLERAGSKDRAGFLGQAYLHLTAALAAFVALEAALVKIPGVDRLVYQLTAGWNWVVVAAAFIFISYVAGRWSQTEHSLLMQYAALAAYIAAEALVFLPLVFFLDQWAGPYALPTAGLLSLTVFAGLTLTVVIGGGELRPGQTLLAAGLWTALGLVGCGLLFEFSPRVIITAGLVATAGACVLVQSYRLGQFRLGQHVGASLSLLSSVGVAILSALQLLITAGQRDRSTSETRT